MKKTIFTILLGAFGALAQAQNPTPAKPQSKPIVLQNGILHLATGEVLQNASLRFENGIITAVGNTVPTEGAEIVPLNGQHVYPSLILPSTTIGLNEIEQIRATLDYEEAGEFNPNVRTQVAFNTDSELLPTIRSNGILILQPTPKGGVVSGTSAVMHADGWNWEDATLRADDGIHINWIPFFTRGGWFSPTPGQMQKNENRGEILLEVENIFKQAHAYTKGTPATKNMKFEAMRGLFDGSKTLYIHVDFNKEIIESVQFAQKHQVKKIVIVGGAQAVEVADFLVQNKIPVILENLHRLPYQKEDAVWQPYQQPYLLKKAGVLVCLAYDISDLRPMGARNLAFVAGTSVAYGLTPEEALQMVTINTAKIFGIDNVVGSLEKGKQATLVVSAGDLLDMRTNNVTLAYIQGRKVDLTDKHKQLYEKFKAKYDKKE
ncbi:MAG: amidohydrolase [Bacteroidetes bacterium]|nr:MAG: amidohydrolase [Bacteroidota bacterium]